MVNTPAAPPPVVVENVPLPPPRATTPLVNVGCRPESPSCAWDNGFPAISADGRSVAKLEYDTDPSGELVGIQLVILDARSQRTLRQLAVFASDGSPADEPSARLRASTARQAAAAQRLLDDGGYRSLVHLGRSDREASPAELAGVHAEVDGELVRAVDPATNRVLWQHRFATPAPRRADPDADCSGWSLHDADVWWDPSTAIVLVTQVYFTGGCLCGDAEIEHVWHARR